MNPIRFGIIGGSWRAEFYMEIARMLPHFFQVECVYLRNAGKREPFCQKWGVETVDTPEELLRKTSLDFIVLAVSKQAAGEWILRLTTEQHNLPVLIETPPAPGLAELRQLARTLPSGARIQVAEQYPLLPHHQARTAVLESGLLGDSVHVRVSAGHGYHGVSLMRRWLGINDNSRCTITGQRLHGTIIEGPQRGRLPQEERYVPSVQDIAVLAWEENNLSALYDFTRDQYFSPIRKMSVLIRGTRGEIADNRISFMHSFSDAGSSMLCREQTGGEGNLSPLSLEGISFRGQFVYRNPFHPAALNDEQTAIADVLFRMGQYARTGDSFYSITEAMHDTYLGYMIDEAVSTGQTIEACFADWLTGSE